MEPKPPLNVFLAVCTLAFISVIPAYADVWIPDNEFVGYFDSGGIYTVVGAVKNTEPYAIVPTVNIEIVENGQTVSVSQTLPTVFPNKDIPFRIAVHQIKSADVVLQMPKITYVQDAVTPQPNIQVVYDKTLIKHDDGHLTGRIINMGNQTEYGLKVYALIHGEGNKVVDVGINVERIEKIEPGQTVDFTIYPDPAVASGVNFYSCFAIGDETIVPLYAMRGGQRFDFRYDSTASFSVVGFDRTGTALSIYGINSFKVPAYVSFEFPRASDGEKLEVLVNDEPVRFIQSLDEYGNWHVAFDVEGASQNDIVIRGFEPQPAAASADAGKSQSEPPADPSLALYVIPAVAAVGLAVYASRRKKKPA